MRVARIPELEFIDELFWRIGHRLPSGSVASPKVSAKLQKPVLDITKASMVDGSSSFYIGMLDDSSVIPQKNGSQVCVIVGDLGGLTFILRGSRIVQSSRAQTSEMCSHPAK